jgi:hypothetical protein
MDDAMIERKLTRALYRLTCPETAELGEYQLDLLDKPRHREIAQHLDACPHCAQEAAHLQHFLAELAPDLRQGVFNPIKVLIARLISQQKSGGQFQPAFAVRGGEQAPRIYEAGDTQIVLEVQQTATPATKTLVGLILGTDTADLTAYLWRDDETINSTEVDEIGNFVLSNVESGNYELIISGAEMEIRVSAVEI